jgi:hypothetical protein
MKHLKLSLCAAMLCLVGAGNSYAGTLADVKCSVAFDWTRLTDKRSCSTSTVNIPRYAKADLTIRTYSSNGTSSVTGTFLNPSNLQVYWERTVSCNAWWGCASGYTVTPHPVFARNIAAKARLVPGPDGARGEVQIVVYRETYDAW